jgi:hypothetical protein
MTEKDSSLKGATNKSKKLSQPNFTEEDIKKLAASLLGRWKYEDGYSTGELDEWTAAFAIGPTDLKTQALFREFNLNDRSPYHWRALLEAFIRDYVTYRGRPKEESLEKFFRFAIDVIQIHLDHVKDDGNDTSVAAALLKIEPYRGRYWETNFDILRKDVKKVRDFVGPMDDDAMDRLSKLDPVRFLDAFVERAGTTEEDLRRWD